MFNQSIFGVSTAAPGAGSWGAEGKNPKYTTLGSEYPGGSGSLTVTGSKDATGAELATKDEFAATELVTYKYDKYSIDGIYFLDGELKMKEATKATGAIPGASAFTAEAGSELKLSEVPATGGDAKDIAKIEFAAEFKPTFAAAAVTACGAIYDVATTHAAITGVKITKAGTATFTELAVATTIGTTTTYASGATAGLMMALVGPRWYS